MMSISKAVRVLSGAIILLLGLFTTPQVGNVAFAADQDKGAEGVPCEVPHGQNAMQAEQAATKESHMVSGEVTRVDGATYVVKDKDGKEVSLRTDEKTEKSPIEKGDRISANVDKDNHALWIRANRGTDRRTEHVSADCNPN